MHHRCVRAALAGVVGVAVVDSFLEIRIQEAAEICVQVRVVGHVLLLRSVEPVDSVGGFVEVRLRIAHFEIQRIAWNGSNCNVSIGNRLAGHGN